MPFVTKARKKNDPALRDPSAGLNKAERELYDVYIRALGGIRNDLNDQNVIRAIREAIEAGVPNDASLALKWQEFIASLQRSVPQLAQQVSNSANISANTLPKKISIESNFTATDPRAVAWAQQRAGARISGIVQESQKAVAEIIANGLRTNLTREQVVRQITEIVGLDTRQAKALANFYEKNLQDLLEDGMTFERAEREALKLSKEYRQRLLVQRATRIARTETLAAANAGRMLSWQEANAQGLLPPGSVKRWKTATDERTCPTCGPLHNTSVAWDGTFPTGDMMPPNHPNCRCTAVIIPGEPIFTQNLEKSVEKRYYRFADGEETWRNYDYRWRKIATELKRKVGKCQRCGSKSDLTVDHKKRLKDGGAKYDRKNLRVLCRSCNGKLARLGTKLRKSKNEWLFAKHLLGKHDQKTHGTGSFSASSDAMDALYDEEFRISNNYDEAKQNGSNIYYQQYSQGKPNFDDPEQAIEANVVYEYASSGYRRMNEYARNDMKSELSGGKILTIEDEIAVLDKAIENSPDVFGENNLYRVFSDRLVEDLQPGDTFVDKGFMSTTRADITRQENRQMRIDLGAIGSSEDTVGVILPSPSRKGKGLAIDWRLRESGYDGSAEYWQKEQEVLLPRGTSLLFLGFMEEGGVSGHKVMGKERIALFQRMDD